MITNHNKSPILKKAEQRIQKGQEPSIEEATSTPNPEKRYSIKNESPNIQKLLFYLDKLGNENMPDRWHYEEAEPNLIEELTKIMENLDYKNLTQNTRDKLLNTLKNAALNSGLYERVISERGKMQPNPFEYQIIRLIILLSGLLRPKENEDKTYNDEKTGNDI